MEDERSADQRREGILRLVADYDFARVEPYTKRYGQIAQSDPDVLVRVAAVRALNASRDPNVTPIAIRDLDDPSVLLRLEAAKALANVPDERAIPGLTRHLAAQFEARGEGGRPETAVESRDVRVACADALRNYHNKDVARTLVDALREREFEVSWQARRSLILMTGHDYHYDAAKWRDFLGKTDNPFGG
jgi:HEAT repeat protein